MEKSSPQVKYQASVTCTRPNTTRLLPPLQGGTERILFVDDEPSQVELAKASLARFGYRVTGFSDSTAALVHFRKDPDAYDLVVTDITMPKMTGDILTRKIHLKRPDLPIVMCTGFSEVM